MFNGYGYHLMSQGNLPSQVASIRILVLLSSLKLDPEILVIRSFIRFYEEVIGQGFLEFY